MSLPCAIDAWPGLRRLRRARAAGDQSRGSPD